MAEHCTTVCLCSPILGCFWTGSCLFLFCTDALLFPGYFSQCNIINFFYVSEPCLLGQWASCVLRSWQLDTTFKLLCAVSHWQSVPRKGQVPFPGVNICPKKIQHPKLMSVNRVILGSGPARHSDQNRLTQLLSAVSGKGQVPLHFTLLEVGIEFTLQKDHTWKGYVPSI